MIIWIVFSVLVGFVVGGIVMHISDVKEINKQTEFTSKFRDEHTTMTKRPISIEEYIRLNSYDSYNQDVMVEYLAYVRRFSDEC